MKLHSILIQYRIVLYVLLPLILIITLVTAIRNRDKRFVWQRFGFFYPALEKGALWFHAASVGEVNAVLPLIKALGQKHPQQQFIITTTTPTGAQIALKNRPHNTRHIYLPIDLPGAVRRFLQHNQPKCAIIMETELWANLYYACHARNINIVIINARLSNKTLQANSWMYRLYAETMSHTSKILARSEHDANGFMTIGASASKVKVIGNIKLAPMDVTDVVPLEDIDRSYFLAASTHENEEELLARAWLATFPHELLVIAPRHPSRSKEIEKGLRKLTPRIAIRSKGDALHSDTQIYLADTLGELPRLIKGADGVFMGGSLVNIGGHNVIEPVRYLKPVMFGPYMDNFKEEASILLNLHIAFQAKDVDALIAIIKRLRNNGPAIEKIQHSAQAFIDDSNDILNRYMRAIEEPVEKYRSNTLLK